MSTQQGERTVDERVTVGGQVMDAHGVVIRALFDPGLFCERKFWPLSYGGGHDVEDLYRWQARAVMEALSVAGHAIESAPNARVTPERNYR